VNLKSITEETTMADVHVHKRPYLWVFLWLAVLTAVEVAVAGLALPNTSRILLLAALAISKAVLVALFYMHLRYDHPILALIGGFPFFLAVIMVLILLADRTLQGGVLGG
jgi:cytochrome c oxidase subunit 4